MKEIGGWPCHVFCLGISAIETLSEARLLHFYLDNHLLYMLRHAAACIIFWYLGVWGLYALMELRRPPPLDIVPD